MSALSFFPPSNRRRCVKGRSSYTEPSDNLLSSLAVNNEFSSDSFNQNDYSCTEPAEPEDGDEEPITIDLSAFLNENPLLAQSAFESAAENNVASTESSSQFRVTDCEIKPSDINNADITKTDFSDVSSTVNINENCAPPVFLADTLISDASNSVKENGLNGQTNFNTLICDLNDNIKENCLNDSSNMHTVPVQNAPVTDITINGKRSPIKKFSKAKPLGLSNPLKKYKNFMKIKDLNKTSMKILGKYPIVKCEKLDIEDFVKNNNIKVSNWPPNQTVKKQKSKNFLKSSIVNRKMSLTKAALKPKVKKPVSFGQYMNNSTAESTSNKLNSILVDSFDTMNPISHSLINTDSWKSEIKTSTPLPKLFSPVKKPSITPRSLISSILNHDALRSNMNLTDFDTTTSSQKFTKNRNGPIITSVNKVANAPKSFKLIVAKPVLGTEEVPNILPKFTKSVFEAAAEPVLNNFTVIEPYVEDPTSPLKPEPIVVPLEVMAPPEKKNILLSDMTVNENTEHLKNAKSTFLNGAIRQISTLSRPGNLVSVIKKDVAKKKIDRESILSQNATQISVAENMKDELPEECPSVLKAKNAVVDAMQSVFSSIHKIKKAKPKILKKEPDLISNPVPDINSTYSSTLNDLLFGFSENDFEDSAFTTEDENNTHAFSADISSDCFIAPNSVKPNREENEYPEKIKEAKTTDEAKKRRNKRKKLLSDSLASDTLSASECENEYTHFSEEKPKKKTRKVTNTSASNSEIVDVTSLSTILTEAEKSNASENMSVSDLLENAKCSGINKSFDYKLTDSSYSFSSLENSSDLKYGDEIKTPLSPSKDKQPEIGNLSPNESPTRTRNKKILKENTNPIIQKTSTRTLRVRKCSSTEVDKSPDYSIGLSADSSKGLLGRSSKLVKGSINSKLKIQMKTPPRSTAKVKIKRKSSKPEDIIQEINTITGGHLKVKTVRGIRKGKKQSDSDKNIKNLDLSSSKDEDSVSNLSSKLDQTSPAFSKKKKTLKVCIKRSKRKNRTSSLKKRLNSVTDVIENLNSTSSITENNESLHSSFRKGKAEKMESPCNEDSIPENITPVSEYSMEVVDKAHIISSVQEDSLVNLESSDVKKSLNVEHSDLSNSVSDIPLYDENQSTNLISDICDKSSQSSENKDVTFVSHTDFKCKSFIPDAENKLDVFYDNTVNVLKSVEDNVKNDNSLAEELLESSEEIHKGNLLPGTDIIDLEKYTVAETNKGVEIENTLSEDDFFESRDSLITKNSDSEFASAKTYIDKIEVNSDNSNNDNVFIQADNMSSVITDDYEKVNALIEAKKSEISNIVISDGFVTPNALIEANSDINDTMILDNTNVNLLTKTDVSQITNAMISDVSEKFNELVKDPEIEYTIAKDNSKIVNALIHPNNSYITDTVISDVSQKINELVEGHSGIMDTIVTDDFGKINELSEIGDSDIITDSIILHDSEKVNVLIEVGKSEIIDSVISDNHNETNLLVEKDNSKVTDAALCNSEQNSILTQLESLTTSSEMDGNVHVKLQENKNKTPKILVDKYLSNTIYPADNSVVAGPTSDNAMIISSSFEDSNKDISVECSNMDINHANSLDEIVLDNSVSSKLISCTSDPEQYKKTPTNLSNYDTILQSNSNVTEKKCPKLKISKNANESGPTSSKSWYVSERRLSYEESYMQSEIPEGKYINIIESSLDTKTKTDSVGSAMENNDSTNTSEENTFSIADISSSIEEASMYIFDENLEKDEVKKIDNNESIEEVSEDKTVTVKPEIKYCGKLGKTFLNINKSSGKKLKKSDEIVAEKSVDIELPESKGILFEKDVLSSNMSDQGVENNSVTDISPSSIETILKDELVENLEKGEINTKDNDVSIEMAKNDIKCPDAFKGETSTVEPVIKRSRKNRGKLCIPFANVDKPSKKKITKLDETTAEKSVDLESPKLKGTRHAKDTLSDEAIENNSVKYVSPSIEAASKGALAGNLEKDEDKTIDYDQNIEIEKDGNKCPDAYKEESATMESKIQSFRKSRGKMQISVANVGKSPSKMLKKSEEAVIEKSIDLQSTKHTGQKNKSSAIATPSPLRKKNYVLDLVLVPFSMGWMREHVLRANGKDNKRPSDIYYFAPDGTKLRSIPDILSYLSKYPDMKLSRENFTFAKELIYREPFEIERDAKQTSKRPNTPTPKNKTSSNTLGSKKKNQETLSSVNTTPSVNPKKKVKNTKSSPLKRTNSSISTESEDSGLPVSSKQKTIDQYLESSERNKNRPARHIVKKVPFDNSDESKAPKKAKLTPNRKSAGDKVSKSPVVVNENEFLVDKSLSTSILDNIHHVTPARTNKSILIQKRLKVKLAPRKSDLPVVQRPCTKFCNFAFARIPSVQCTICLCLFHPECIPFTPAPDKVYACGPCVKNHINTFKYEDLGLLVPDVETELLYPISNLYMQTDPYFITAFNKYISPADQSFQQAYINNITPQQTCCNPVINNIAYPNIAPVSHCNFREGKTNADQYLNKPNIWYLPSPADGSVPLKQLKTFVATSNFRTCSNIPSRLHSGPTYPMSQNYHFPYPNNSSYKIMSNSSGVQCRTMVPQSVSRDISDFVSTSSSDKDQLPNVGIIKEPPIPVIAELSDISESSSSTIIYGDKNNQSLSVLQSLLQNKDTIECNSSNMDINNDSSNVSIDKRMYPENIKLIDCSKAKYVDPSSIPIAPTFGPDTMLNKDLNSIPVNQNVCSPCMPWPFFRNMQPVTNVPESIFIPQQLESNQVKPFSFGGMLPFNHALLNRHPIPPHITPPSFSALVDTPQDYSEHLVKRKNPPGYLRDYSRGTESKKLCLEESFQISDNSINGGEHRTNSLPSNISVDNSLNNEDSSEYIDVVEVDDVKSNVCLQQLTTIEDTIKSRDSSESEGSSIKNVDQSNNCLQRLSPVHHPVKTADFDQDTPKEILMQSNKCSLQQSSMNYQEKTIKSDIINVSEDDMEQHRDSSLQDLYVENSVQNKVSSQPVSEFEDRSKKNYDLPGEHSFSLTVSTEESKTLEDLLNSDDSSEDQPSPHHLLNTDKSGASECLQDDSDSSSEVLLSEHASVKPADVSSLAHDGDQEGSVIDEVSCSQQLSPTSNKSDFSQLSESFLLLVFKNLSICDLLHASMVCRNWERVAVQKVLWERVCFSGLVITSWRECCRFLQKCGTKYIDMRDIFNEQSIEWWKFFSKHMHHLMEVEELIFETVPPFVIRAITEHLPLLKNLTCYCVTTAFTEPEIWSTPCELELAPLRSLGFLQRLKISCMGGILLDNTKESKMPYLPNLTHVVLTGFKWRNYIDLELLSHQQQLISLELGDCANIEPKVYELLAKMTNLRNLCLQNGGSLNDTKLPKAISKMRRLVNLELMNFQVSRHFPDVLDKMDNLRHFSVWPDIRFEAAIVNYYSFRAMISCTNLMSIEWGVLIEDESTSPEIYEMKDPNKNESEKLTYEEFFKTLVKYFPGSNVVIESFPRHSWSEFCCSRNFI